MKKHSIRAQLLREIKELKREVVSLKDENKKLKERRRRWDEGAADRRWKALGGSW